MEKKNTTSLNFEPPKISNKTSFENLKCDGILVLHPNSQLSIFEYDTTLEKLKKRDVEIHEIKKLLQHKVYFYQGITIRVLLDFIERYSLTQFFEEFHPYSQVDKILGLTTYKNNIQKTQDFSKIYITKNVEIFDTSVDIFTNLFALKDTDSFIYSLELVSIENSMDTEIILTNKAQVYSFSDGTAKIYETSTTLVEALTTIFSNFLELE